MIITLTAMDQISVIEADADAKYISNIVEETQWIMSHISSDNTGVLLHDLRVAIPVLTALDVMSIQNVMSKPVRWEKRFVEICNILAKGEIFKLANHIDFRISDI